MLKRLLALFMLISICVVTSCSGGSVSLLSFMPPESEEQIDFEGYVFKMLGSVDPEKKESEGAALSVFDDALIAWDDYIEKTYNCTIEHEDTGPDRFMPSRDYTPKIVSGLADWSLMSFIAIDLVNLYKGGFISPWNDTSLDIMDLDKYFGSNEQYKESSTFNGKTYGITASNWSTHVSFEGIVVTNNNLLKNYTDVRVHEMKENGKWTFDGFKELLELCTVSSGDSMPIIPLANFNSEVLAPTCIFANGGQIVDYDETTGKYSYGLTSAKAVKGIEYAKSLYNEGLCSHSIQSGRNFWEDETSVFYLGIEEGLSEGIKKINDMDVITFPYGPDAEYGKTCSAYINRYVGYAVCPITADVELTAKFVSLWYEPMKDLPKEDIVSEFKNTMFYNDESINEFFFMAENAQNTYYTHFGDYGEKLTDTLSALVTDNGTVAQILDSTRRMFEDHINNSFNGN